MNGFVRAASLVQWDLFVTLTFASNRLGQSEANEADFARRRMFFAFVRKVEKSFGVPRGFLLCLARQERGEKSGRFHFHALVGGLYHVAGRGVVPSPNITSDRHRIVSLWKQCGTGAGHADVRAYDFRLSGEQYIMKGLEHSDFSTSGANAYELAKFDDSQGRQLILTPAFLRHVEMRSSNRRHRKARELKVATGDRSARGVNLRIPKPARPTQPDMANGRQSAW